MAPSQIIRMIRNHTSRKVLFGTDSPWCLQSDQIKIIKGLGLSEMEENNILGENASRLLLDK